MEAPRAAVRYFAGLRRFSITVHRQPIVSRHTLSRTVSTLLPVDPGCPLYDCLEVSVISFDAYTLVSAVGILLRGAPVGCFVWEIYVKVSSTKAVLAARSDTAPLPFGTAQCVAAIPVACFSNRKL